MTEPTMQLPAYGIMFGPADPPGYLPEQPWYVPGREDNPPDADVIAWAAEAAAFDYTYTAD